MPGAAGASGRAQPGQLRRLGPAAAGRVEVVARPTAARPTCPVNLLGQDGQVYFGVDGNYRSEFSSNPSPSVYTWIDGYALTNFRVGFRAGQGLNIYGWVRNAFDDDYFDQLGVGPGNTGLIAGQPGDPRTFGGTLGALRLLIRCGRLVARSEPAQLRLLAARPVVGYAIGNPERDYSRLVRQTLDHHPGRGLIGWRAAMLGLAHLCPSFQGGGKRDGEPESFEGQVR